MTFQTTGVLFTIVFFPGNWLQYKFTNNTTCLDKLKDFYLGQLYSTLFYLNLPDSEESLNFR